MPVALTYLELNVMSRWAEFLISERRRREGGETLP